jgi:hypothetical protein
MFTLKSAAREILAYVSLKPKEQTEYFKAAREITDAQFCLANRLHSKAAPKCHWCSRMLKRVVRHLRARGKKNKISPGQQ